MANAALKRALVIRRQLSNLDVQKIVYFLHGHHLIRHQFPLVKGEFEAWPDYDGADEEDDEWCVGYELIEISGPPVRRLSYESRPPICREIAKVTGRKFAEALAEHFNALIAVRPAV